MAMAARALLAAAVLVVAVAAAVVVAASSPAPASAFSFTEHDLASEEALSALYERWRAHHKNHMPRRHRHRHAGAGDDDDGEKARRFSVFKEKALFVHEFNNNNHGGLRRRPYKLGLNLFSDMSSEELKAAGYGGCAYPYYNNNKLPLHNKGNNNNNNNVSAAVELEPPAQRDWRVKGAVTEVKNQNPCGSCWAFTAAAAVESLVFLKTGSLVPLSEQQLIDCDTSSPNNGCNGGSVAKAFIYIAGTGLTSQEHYPYERSQGPCEAEMDTPVFARISGFAAVPPFDGNAMLRRVAVQPVAAIIAVNENLLTAYTGGVFTGPCGSPTVWHAVTVVGYGTHDDDGDGTSLNYWVVKNSWGPSWGEGGYIRISRDEGGNDGVCRILFNPLYPLWGKVSS